MLKKLTNFIPEEFESQKHPFTIKRLSPTIGAELHDIDLSKDLSEEEKEHIYGALLTYKVIFFAIKISLQSIIYDLENILEN